jgi:intein-encoded DNA endonuclease-like protein
LKSSLAIRPLFDEVMEKRSISKCVLAYQLEKASVPRAKIAEQLRIKPENLRAYIWQGKNRELVLKKGRERGKAKYLRKVGKLVKPRISWSPSPSPHLSYILGAILGDGYVTSKTGKYVISLNVNDKTFADTFRVSLEKIGLSPHMKFRQNQWHVWACNKDFCEWFKTLTLNNIENIICSSKEMIKLFIMGFYDSEGSLEVTNKKQGHRGVIFYNTNIELLRVIQKLLNHLEFHSVLALDRKAGKESRLPNGKVIISKKDSYRLGIYRQEDVRRFLMEIGSNIPRKGGVEWLNA